MKYRKKQMIIDAIKWTGDNEDEIKKFCSAIELSYSTLQPVMLCVHTIAGIMAANQNDWIIKTETGQFYPCKPDIFEKTYEKVEE